MSQQMRVDDLEQVYQALANERRITVVRYLKKCRRASVGDVSEHLRLSFAATSRHLNILKDARILEDQQEGLLVYYSIRSPLPPHIAHMIKPI